MKTLEKTMREFVLETAKERVAMESNGWDYTPSDFNKVLNYAKSLSTPLTLGMFICVDEDGNVLEEPSVLNVDSFEYKSKYQKALTNVLFEGFHLQHIASNFKTVSNGGIQITLDQYGLYLEPHDSVDGERIEVIEDLIPYKLKLTDNFTID